MKASGSDYATAAAKLGYDPNLVYSDEFKDDEGNPLNVLLFAYGAPDKNGYATESTTKVTLKATDNLLISVTELLTLLGIQFSRVQSNSFT